MPRLFRVFVSSFLDMAEERRALAEGVFGPLGEFCAARGASFQAVDLRWGISPQAVLEQQTMPICLTEVRRCVQVSPQLNFLALIGDRRGWLPVPTTIPADEFALFAADLTAAERRLVDDWYRIDNNAVPPALRLRFRRDLDDDGWARIERHLREILERVAHRLPQHRRLAYLGSAVEQEVAAGVLSVADAAGAFAVVRERGPRGDAEGRHLDSLEAELRERLSPDQVLTLRADDYQESLVATVRARFTEVIESALDDEPSDANPSATTAVHRRLADRLLAVGAPIANAPLIGRHAAFADLARFARTPGQGLLGIVGSAGVGKSALVGAVATETAETAGPDGSGEPLVILRLLGTTAATTRLDGLLRGLVEEIAAGFKVTIPPAPDVPELIRQLAELLTRAGSDRPVMLFLDAIDQLAADHAAHQLGWLPDPVPPHVRVVVSTLPGPTQDALYARTDSALRHLDGLNVEEGRLLLRRWLAAAERTLTVAQERAVLAAFAPQGRPLWLRLAFEHARNWPSDTAPPALPHDLLDLVRVLFDRLADAAAHGPTLVRHVLALLAASGFGLSELDMLTTLSADPQVIGGGAGPHARTLARGPDRVPGGALGAATRRPRALPDRARCRRRRATRLLPSGAAGYSRRRGPTTTARGGPPSAAGRAVHPGRRSRRQPIVAGRRAPPVRPATDPPAGRWILDRTCAHPARLPFPASEGHPRRPRVEH